MADYSTLKKIEKIAQSHSHPTMASETDKNHQLSMIKGKAALKRASAKYRLKQWVRSSMGSGKIIEISANGSITIRTQRGLRKVISPEAIIDD
jgi:hypothetical protein